MSFIKPVLTFLLFLIANHAHGSNSIEISKSDIFKILNSVDLSTARDPITEEGRRSVNSYLNQRLNQIIAYAQTTNRLKYKLLTKTFQSQIYVNSQNSEKRIDGSNYIVVLEGSRNSSEDEPIAIIANYDTDTSETNPVDSNGSGIVALLAILEHLVDKIVGGKIMLEKTVILAAIDISINKYELGAPKTAQSGADILAKEWLPEFMEGRRGFQGAIVLDSILNFNDETRSQSSNGISKAFPSAYSQMSGNEFKGDFLAVVQRDNVFEEDKLVRSFERNWKESIAKVYDDKDDTNLSNQPQLLKFKFPPTTLNSEAEAHFLKSEQSSFWMNKYPAILLTDTEKYRTADCIHSGCSQASMTSPKNIAFFQGNINAVYATILDLQTDNHSPEHNNAMSRIQNNLSFVTIIIALFSTFFLSYY